MAKDQDPKNNTNQSGNDDGKQNTVNISADDFNQMKSNMKHMSNTVKNLSTKLENAHKSGNNPKPDKQITHKPSQTGKNFVSRDEFDKLSKGYQALNNRIQKQSNHDDVLKQAKADLKANHMKVSPSTFNHLLGADAKSTDDNIKWFKGVYQKAYSKPKRFPPATHHSHSKTTIGEQIAKDDAKNGGTRNINDCFKN